MDINYALARKIAALILIFNVFWIIVIEIHLPVAITKMILNINYTRSIVLFMLWWRIRLNWWLVLVYEVSQLDMNLTYLMLIEKVSIIYHRLVKQLKILLCVVFLKVSTLNQTSTSWKTYIQSHKFKLKLNFKAQRIKDLESSRI